jgi:hypothetical protein
MGLFDFILMANNYKDRKVARTEANDFIIDTCMVNDSEKPYETGISHKKYNSGKWIIVELYDTKEDALKGHQKWMAITNQKNLPEKLIDVSTAEICIGRDNIEFEKED